MFVVSYGTEYIAIEEKNTTLTSLEGLEITRAHFALPEPRIMTTKFVRLTLMLSRCRWKKNASSISVTMSTPNILVACKHPYLVIRKNKLDPEHALVEYNKLLIDLVNTTTCFNLNIGKHGTLYLINI